MPEPEMFPNPILSEKMLHRFVQGYMDRRKVYQDLFQTHGSPLWILESSVLKEKALRFSRAFNQYFDKTGYYFAMKSNNHPEVSLTLLESGFGLDVSSGEELKTALALNAKDIIFSGPGKTNEELSLAIMNQDRTIILLDSFGELERLNALASVSSATPPVRVGIRLTTNPGELWRKFGIVLERLPDFWNRIKSLPHVRFMGLQFHSSWNLTPDKQIEFIRRLGLALAQMPQAFHQQVEFIDIGGGYWPEEGEWLHSSGTSDVLTNVPVNTPMDQVRPHYAIPATSIEDFAKALFKAISAHIFPLVNCRICFEPGRWICHSAMHLLFTVIDKKGTDLVIADAGTNVIGWERFETDYFPILNLSRPGIEEKPCYILGSLCTPHDVWGYAYFGNTIKEKDCLMIPCQGAYTYCLGQNFIKALPKFVKI